MDRSWFGRSLRFLRTLSPVATLTTLLVISLLGQSGTDTLRRSHPVSTDALSFARARGETSSAAGHHDNRLLITPDSSTRNKARPADLSGDGILPVVRIWLPSGSAARLASRTVRGNVFSVLQAYQPRAPPRGKA